ncbi:MAG: HDOD domain-containing protein [Deltaproteobacteria bacterium]|nr:HDOD domain-containing protein [Deltaproteobacteria bacterium]
MAVLLQAELNFMPLHDIMQWIDMNRISCEVVVSEQNETAIIFYMESGKIIFASSNKPGKRLGEFLVMSGVMSELEARSALKESRNQGVSFTRYLINKNLITLQVLNENFAKLVEMLLVEVLSCCNASVSVKTPLPESVINGPIQLETGRAIFDAVRVIDEMERDTRKRDEAFENINRRIFNEEFQLPVMPGVVVQLSALIQNENSSFQDMAKLIMTDQILVSSILKIANSALYGGTGQVDSLQFAIVKLGMREIMNIVTAIQLKSVKFQGVPQEKLQTILDNSLKTAFMASGLARLCRLDPEEAFMAGLLLDLGQTVILSVAGNSRIEQTLLDDILRSRHAEIGALIAKKWNYPESIQRLIRYHHNQNFGGISNRMIDMIQIADSIIQTNGEGEPGTEQMTSLQLSYEAVLDVYSKTIDTYQRIRSL